MVRLTNFGAALAGVLAEVLAAALVVDLLAVVDDFAVELAELLTALVLVDPAGFDGGTVLRSRSLIRI